MFCKYCGNELPENANFCPKCGKINETTAPNPQEEPQYVPPIDLIDPNYYSTSPVDPRQQEKDDLGGSILKYAILGLAFGSTFWLAILGLAFTIVARAKLSTYISNFSETEGRASVGKALSIAGLAVNITFLAISLLTVCTIAIGVAASM
ncbi:MAG: zinc ribbon domain-containing protein [Clostridia bacterium]|nr:zinc ribbon domain-containing protein [Clostridia bacterium]